MTLNYTAGLTIDPAHNALDIFDQDITRDVWLEKYRANDEPGPFTSFERVCDGVYKGDTKGHRLAGLTAMKLGLWMPAGRIQAGAGTKKHVTLMNCFVNGTIDDSMEGIFKGLTHNALTLRMGGGVGTDFTPLRPEFARLGRLGDGVYSSGPVSFMDVWDASCTTIMSAGQRRGAMMGTLADHHPDLPKFLRAKTEKGVLTQFNISILVSDAFMDAVRHGEDWDLYFHQPPTHKEPIGTFKDDSDVTQYIYERRDARSLWDDIIRTTYEFSEPGVIFIDRINDLSNLAYCEDIRCTNPCVTGDTKILTDRGHLPIKGLVGERVKIWNGEVFSEVVPFSTGVNGTLKITFSNGQIVRCTDYHKWKLSGGHLIKAKDLRVGDKLIYSEMPTIDKGALFELDAYSQGFYCGDGTKDSEYSNLYKHEQSIRDRLVGKIYDRNCKSQPGYRWVHGKMFPKDFVPTMGYRKYCVDWLAGLLDADGCVSKRHSGNVLEISAKDRNFLRKVGLMLNRLGVNYRMWERSDAGYKTGSNNKTYYCESTASLMIAWKGVYHLTSLGLVCERIDLSSFQEAPKGVARVGHRVVSIEPGKDEETYCFNEPLRNMGVFNGVLGHNCGEQPLPPYGCCLLGAINLARLVKNPFRSSEFASEMAPRFDFDTLKVVTRIAVRFMDNVIDVTKYPLPEQKAEELSKRRIGLGISGLADAMTQSGLTYGSADSEAFTRRVMRTIAIEAYTSSALLAKERGPFPKYFLKDFIERPFVQKLPIEVRQLIAKDGIRNGTLLTIAPTGTTSLYYGDISSGLEPVFRHRGIRNVLQPDGSRKPYDTENYGYRLYQSIHGASAPDELPEYMVSVDKLSVSDHLRIQAAAQEWVDASVSKTINCSEDIDFEEFMDVYNLAYDLGCKGCTTYRPSAIRGSVLEEAKATEATQPRLPTRPPILEGRTYKITWPTLPSALYLTVNRHDRNGKHPFEIFINSRSSQNAEWMTALTLMISAIMRMSDDVEFIAAELQQVVSAHDSAWIDGTYYGSLVARIGKVLQEHFDSEGVTAAEPVQEPSPDREIRPGDTVTSTAGGTRITRPDYTMHGHGPTTLQEALELHTRLTGNALCPACGAPALVHQEGCAKCTQCEYSNCG